MFSYKENIYLIMDNVGVIDHYVRTRHFLPIYITKKNVLMGEMYSIENIPEYRVKRQIMWHDYGFICVNISAEKFDNGIIITHKLIDMRTLERYTLKVFVS